MSEISSIEYISKLQSVIESSYKCRATHRRTITTRASRDPNWPTRVEMFWLSGHATAKRCFAWIDPVATSQTFAVLEIPPVIGAATAVQAALASRSQQTGRQDESRQFAIG